MRGSDRMESEASIICLSLREKVGGNCQGNGEKVSLIKIGIVHLK